MQEVRCSSHRATTLQARAPTGFFFLLANKHFRLYLLSLQEESLSQLGIFYRAEGITYFALEKSMLKVRQWPCII